MRIAALRADIWNCWGTPETMAQKIAVFDAHCEAVSRDPAAVERSTQAVVLMSQDQATLDTWRHETSPMPVLIGSPAEISEQIGAYERLGISEFVVSDRSLGREVSARLDRMATFLDEVAAPFRN
jgi:alkanesulfonate monooxygenase SsuD/methylene tetrahydromethanopterin reductase-like flavin-dependent oxidoreductase (luciferase family)